MSRRYMPAACGFIEGFAIPVAVYLIGGFVGQLSFELLPLFLGISILCGTGLAIYRHHETHDTEQHLVDLQKQKIKLLKLEAAYVELIAGQDSTLQNQENLLEQLRKEHSTKNKKYLRLEAEIEAAMLATENSLDPVIQEFRAKYENPIPRTPTPEPDSPRDESSHPDNSHSLPDEKPRGGWYYLGYVVSKMLFPLAAIISCFYGFTAEAFEFAEDISESVWHIVLGAIALVTLVLSGFATKHRFEEERSYKKVLLEYKDAQTNVNSLFEKKNKQSQMIKTNRAEIKELKGDIKTIDTELYHFENDLKVFNTHIRNSSTESLVRLSEETPPAPNIAHHIPQPEKGQSSHLVH